MTSVAVASKNPFALLNDEEGSSPAAAKSTSAQTTASGQKKDAPGAKTAGGNRGRSGPASRGGRYYARGGGAPKPAEEPAVGGDENTGARFDRTQGRENRGRGRGRGRGDAPFRGNKRQFDRHSATGVVDSEKQINQGWGADTGKAELEAETSGRADADADVTAATGEDATAPAWGAPADDAAGGQEEDRRAREEEPDNTITFDDYMKKKDNSALAGLVGSLGGRQANEGDNELFKDAVQITKGENEESYFVGKTKSAPKARKAKEEKVTIEIDGDFADTRDRSRGGYRGGRGGDRGGRGAPRGAGRGGRGRGRGQTNGGLDVADETAFPSLGAA